jgi:putative DNA primase/helicase
MPGGHSFTDDGNALRLIDHADGKLKSCPQIGWYVWNGMTWDPSEETALQMAREAARKIADEAPTPPSIPEGANSELVASARKAYASERAAIQKWAHASLAYYRITSMLRLAKSEPGISVDASLLNPDRLLLNCQNGMLELSEGVLVPHDPDRYCTYAIPVEFDPDAECPRWMEFLDLITKGNVDIQRTLQRAAGYCLTGLTSEQCIFILYGMGANGKSTFLSVMRQLMGPYATHVPADVILVKKNGAGASNDIAMLHGKRLVTCTESEAGGVLNDARVKAITGEETITARFLYHEHFEYPIQFKIWLGTNHKPRIPRSDEGIWRRIRLIPFEASISEDKQEKDFARRFLFPELPGILNWAARGCLLYQESGLRLAATIVDATAEYRDDEDVLGEFISDCLVAKDGEMLWNDTMYTVYAKWCEASGLRVMSRKRLTGELKQRGFRNERNAYARYWKDLALSPDGEAAKSRAASSVSMWA